MTLSNYLKRYGISQQLLAERIGVTQSTVSRYVSGERMPKREQLLRIMEETGGLVTPTDFLLVNAKLAYPVASVHRN